MKLLTGRERLQTAKQQQRQRNRMGEDEWECWNGSNSWSEWIGHRLSKSTDFLSRFEEGAVRCRLCKHPQSRDRGLFNFWWHAGGMHVGVFGDVSL
jgi:hypothetical protein